ncbi:AmpG family muropeptide MFS transporter [uncultured Draconibacterium sp.]|uniref:AmpG family muropeptide MFS transporter n=1 Tax=uncultured Draconibacterium sp. TaxID=1573823 RepID=UPI0025EEBEA5|nr:AmpG family muropeptide MFS transporter [uncultured Draconibacterium sp.]
MNVKKPNRNKNRNPWYWIPSLYFAEGLPYIIVMTVSVIMYKRLDISNTEIAFYTSWLYLPWVIKPFWSPLVELFKTKRWWIVIMQLFIGAGLAGVALTLPTSFFFKASLAFLWLLAFSSATHDIAADGFYMMGLNENQQAFFVGIRNTFYRIAMVTGQGLLVVLAGFLENSTILGNPENGNNIPIAWAITFIVMAIAFLLFSVYHKIFLPFPKDDLEKATKNIKQVFEGFGETINAYFRKKEIWTILGFLLLYRLGESQLVKMASPFLLDSTDTGGLALTTQEVGIAYGTIGIIALTIGGIAGGWLASKYGFKRLLWAFVFSINLPNLVYVFLSYVQPGQYWIVVSAVAVEQLGYGFGFTAYTLYMLYVSAGKYKTAHYAFSTGIMALGMMLPGMISGWLQEFLGYQHFFIWVMICTIPGFIMAALIKVDRDFGLKKS